MKIVKNLLRYLTSLILVFVLLFAQFVFFVRAVFLNPVFYIDRLAETKYYSEVRKELDNGLYNLSLMTDVPLEVLTESVKDISIVHISENSIRHAANYMKYQLDYIPQSINMDGINKVLYAFMDDYALENNVEKDEALRAQIDSICNDVYNLVNNHAVLFNIDAVKGFTQFQSFRRYLYILYNQGLLVTFLMMACIIFLYLLNIRRLRRVLLWAGSSMIAASFMTIIPSAMAHIYRIPHRLSITSSYLKIALTEFVTGYVNYFLFTGIALLLVGAAFLAAYVLLRNKAIKKEFDRHNIAES